MKVEELRIGNWIQVDDLKPEQVTLETFATLKEYPHHISLFNPIPITPEWLEMLGFEKDMDGYYTITEGGRVSFQIFVNGEDVTTYIETNVGMGFNTVVLNPPQYVHTLQNLFYSLTGKELELKK